MPYPTDRKFRDKVTEALRPFCDTEFSPDDFFEMIEEDFFSGRPSNNKISRDNFGRQLDFAYLCVYYIRIISVAIGKGTENTETDEKPWGPTLIIERDEPSLSHKGFIIHCQLDGLVNYYLAILRLIEDGLTQQAHCLLRTADELSWLLIVLLYDNEKFKLYHNTAEMSREERTKVWYKNFKASLLLKTIKQIDSSVLHFGTEIYDDFDAEINSNSDYIHSSFSASVIGSYGLPLDKTDRLFTLVTGCPNQDIKKIIETTDYSLMYFIKAFTVILAQKCIVRQGEYDILKAIYTSMQQSAECISDYDDSN